MSINYRNSNTRIKMKNYFNNLSLFSLTTIITFTFVVIFSNNFQLIQAIRTASGNDGLLRTTRKPDYSDVYEKIDDNDIFKNIRRIMRIGDPANGVPVMAPFKRDHQFHSEPENELGNVEHQRVEGLDQFVTKSSLIYSNNEKFDFSLLWPKVSFISRHSSTRNYRVFYSNYTFVGCTLKGEADVQRTSIDENCFKLKDLRLTLHFKNYDVNVVTTSNNEHDKEIARTAKQTLDRYIKQEYTLGLEKPAYELEQKIKEYFGNYRCLLQEEPPIQRPSRKNDRDDRAFIDFDRTIFTERPSYTPDRNREVSRPAQSDYDRNFQNNFNDNQRQTNNNERDRDRGTTYTTESNYDDRRPGGSIYAANDEHYINHQSNKNNNNNNNNNNRNNRNLNPDPIYFPSDDTRYVASHNSNSDTSYQNSRTQQISQSNQTPLYPQSNRTFNISSTTRRTTLSSSQQSALQQRSTSTTVRSRSPSSSSSSSLSSQNQASIQTQTSVNPIYRTTSTQSRTTTTQPIHSYYEYSRLI